MFTRLVCLCLLVQSLMPLPNCSADTRIDFANEVRPILADACFQCHGPDEEAREVDLRLDIASEAASTIVPGKPDESDLVERICSPDQDLLMPPPDSGKSLSAEQIAILKSWIEQGAEFESHWAFSKPIRPAVPKVQAADWPINAIDNFVTRRLEAEKLAPSKRADSLTLVRRLSLDLTGLPPSPQFAKEWAQRIDQTDATAYEQLIETLLRSEHFGEKWAREWLDAARYADSDGYEKDKPRSVWFYRDWVINSLNQDRPYDDFIIRQIAGDLLPNATQDDIVATGFLRNSMVNEEGGADPEQFRMEAMFDRMDAVGKAVLGLTIQCAQCHTHKYDPLQHEEYYQMFACLNSTYDAISSVYTQEEQQQREQVLSEIENAKKSIQANVPDWQARLIAWAKQEATVAHPQWSTPKLEFSDTSLGGSKFLRQEDGSYLCQSYAPTSFRPLMSAEFEGSQLTGIQLELLNHPMLPRLGPGRSVDGTWALSEVTVEIALSGSPGKKQKVKIGRALADRSPAEADLKTRYDNKKKEKRITGGIHFAIDGDEKTAWTNEVDTPQSNTPNVAWFAFEQPFEVPEGQKATVTIGLSQRHGGWNSDDNQTFNIGCFRLSWTSDAIPDRSPIGETLLALVRRSPDSWNAEERRTVFNHWRLIEPEAQPWNAAIEAAWKRHPLGTTQLALQARPSPRPTWQLARGDFLSHMKRVEPGTPAFLHAMPAEDGPARLRFARWLVSEESPTTARSIVNRIWQAYFGRGLVATSDDLGTQSAPPSHPELLDFLARELIDSGWSLKHLHRMIVSSATYQQTSSVTPQQEQLDPYNRLLARGARFRVPAETVRDIALAASGLLDRTIGGRSVYPPAPSFLFSPPVSYGPKVWNEEQDSQRYRRAMYTFRFRSVLYPMLENFDATPCNVSCVRRSSSNTPMQALTALNEPLFRECAIALAEKTLTACEGESDAAKIEFVVWHCLSRPPSEREAGVLTDYLGKQRTRISSDSIDAGSLDSSEIISSHRRIDGSSLAADELAAWTLLCRVCLNLDETITRE